MESCSPNPALDPYAVELHALEDYRIFSATTIQRYYRGWICRLKQGRQKDAQLQRQLAQTAAAREQQQLYRAAKAIQCAWRSFNNQRIYRYYRDLIRFKEAGDPRQMLRCINAREAALVDPAAGLHVRFRLGGSSFPPLIFYRIYTHRPVADIGAFGPRNYAAETAAAVHSPAAALHRKPDGPVCSCSSSDSLATSCKQVQQQADEEFELPAKLREFVRSDGSVGYHSTRGWYRRKDSNGWRPVAERLLLDQAHQAALPASTHSGSGSSSSRCRRRKKHRQRHCLQVAGMPGSGLGNASCACVAKPQQQQQDGSSSNDGSEAGNYQGSSEASSIGRSSPVYHYSSIVRREDRARRLKQRRRQWLLKMYRAGMQDSTACENRTGACSQTAQSSYAAAAAVGGARHLGSQPLSSSRLPADGQTGSCSEEERILQLLEQQMLNEATDNTIMNSSMMGDSSSGDAAHDGWDVEELVALGLDAGILAWSQKLDFDSYQQHWNSTAVTLGSSVCVPVSEKAAA